ncbi:ThuA domain-containing protein [Paenibacillus thalictri]|uniref:ThuA domain-containing protein n=1 Tax=Paenibacillus thalictri TaxID=2527873 RepID=A0A4Q9DL34_9BACL|nr:ThuA domain-containing protein [Paenibacillus thalictri]TBL73967.1 ThuA domain-containing protein [Paenibacillus thalictri]
MADITRSALLLGDDTNSKYHPLQAVEQEIIGVFQEHLHIRSTVDRTALEPAQLDSYDLCISYTDSWRVPVSPEQTAGLLAYVSGGGGLLVIHNGISLQARYELTQLAGAKFTGHPPYGPLAFTPAEGAEGHEIMQGIAAFEMDEEPYRFDFDPFTEKTVLLEYTHEGAKWPAAWAQEYGLGRVVYLMPGHHVHSFRHDVYRKLIVQSGLWAARRSSVEAAR